MNVSKNVIELNSKDDKGEIISISIYDNRRNNYSEKGLTTLKDGELKMLVSSSISKSGELWNITSSFSEDQFSISEIHSPEPFNITVQIKPTKAVVPGNYTLTVGARYEDSITYSKILDMIIR